ncbi:MAG: hypothetical protein GY796_34460 [Chloroflexi bacterium]|nr:hypothetical protein [Chloroflexota bacterium]
MANSKIGFHTGPGGNKNGLGLWERACNDAGIPFGLKAADHYGPLVEALQVGRERNVENWLGFRFTKAAGRMSRETPNYDVDPKQDAPILCKELLLNLPSEFDKAVWLELINEPRAQNKAGDTMFNNMAACDYLGEWCLAAAKYLNARGYKFAGPSFNSGEPGNEGVGLADAVTQYSQPGMLKYLRYCAQNPNKAALSVHEYSWSLWQDGQTAVNWYPQLWGRFEAAIAAADLHNIPRTFPIFVTEFGFAHNKAPQGQTVVSFLDARNEMTARWPQLKFDAAWTLQSGWDNVDNHVNSWMNYSVSKTFDKGEQPAKTHNAFGGTLPGITRPPETRTPDVPESEPEPEEVVTLPDESPSPPPKHGLVIDVSAHNVIDWDAIRCDGVLVRASNGINRSSGSTDADGIDKQFWRNMEGIQKRGLPFGIYHFYNEKIGVEQVAHFMKIVKTTVARGFTPSMGLWLDFEETSPTDEADIRAGCKELISLNDTGQPVGIYTRANWWNDIIPASSTWPSNFLLWSANWVSNNPIDTPPRTDWRFLSPRHWQKHKANVWQFTSKGGQIVGHDRPNLDVSYWMGFEDFGVGASNGSGAQAPSSGLVVDVLPFIRGKHRRQFDKEYRFDNGVSGTQTTQIWHLDKNNWLYIKGENGEYERLGVRKFQGEDWIFRFEDTSEGPDRFYAHFRSEGGQIGAPWVPCKMKVGRLYETPKFVQHYRKSDGAKLNNGNVVDKIRLLARPADKTYLNSGQTVENVITLEWQGGEQYDFADGNIAFRDDGRKFWFMANLNGRPDKSFDKPIGINLNW